MKPKLGQSVHYRSYGSPNGEYPSVCRAADITAVLGDVVTVFTDQYNAVVTESVDLFVKNPDGVFFNHRVLRGPYDKGGYWHYEDDCGNGTARWSLPGNPPYFDEAAFLNEDGTNPLFDDSETDINKFMVGAAVEEEVPEDKPIQYWKTRDGEFVGIVGGGRVEIEIEENKGPYYHYSVDADQAVPFKEYSSKWRQMRRKELHQDIEYFNAKLAQAVAELEKFDVSL